MRVYRNSKNCKVRTTNLSVSTLKFLFLNYSIIQKLIENVKISKYLCAIYNSFQFIKSIYSSNSILILELRKKVLRI